MSADYTPPMPMSFRIDPLEKRFNANGLHMQMYVSFPVAEWNLAQNRLLQSGDAGEQPSPRAIMHDILNHGDGYRTGVVDSYRDASPIAAIDDVTLEQKKPQLEQAWGNLTGGTVPLPEKSYDKKASDSFVWNDQGHEQAPRIIEFIQYAEQFAQLLGKDGEDLRAKIDNNEGVSNLLIQHTDNGGVIVSVCSEGTDMIASPIKQLAVF